MQLRRRALLTMPLAAGFAATAQAQSADWARLVEAANQQGHLAILHNVPCGHPHVDAKNIEGLIEQGFRWLMPGPVPSFTALEIGRRVSGRA
ncbi:MAG: hypothetical protein ACHQIO_08965 [Nevskiales bacterium]